MFFSKRRFLKYLINEINNYDGKYLASYPREQREKYEMYYSLGLISDKDLKLLIDKCTLRFNEIHEQFYGA